MAPALTENDFDFYLRFAKPLVLNLSEPDDRVLAAAWIQKLRNENVGDVRLRTNYLKLLLFVLQRNTLLGPFVENPNNHDKLSEFPEEKLKDVAKKMLEWEEEYRKKQATNSSGDYPPYTIEYSSDLLEYAAAQNIPNFGIHAYYAISNEPITNWSRTEKTVFPRGAISATDQTKQSGQVNETSSERSVSSKRVKFKFEQRTVFQSPIYSSPIPQQSPKPKSPITQQGDIDLSRVGSEDERSAPTWGSNLIWVSEPPITQHTTTPIPTEVEEELPENSQAGFGDNDFADQIAQLSRYSPIHQSPHSYSPEETDLFNEGEPSFTTEMFSPPQISPKSPPRIHFDIADTSFCTPPPVNLADYIRQPRTSPMSPYEMAVCGGVRPMPLPNEFQEFDQMLDDYERDAITHPKQQVPTVSLSSTTPHIPIASSSTEPQISPPDIPLPPEHFPSTTSDGTSNEELDQMLDDYQGDVVTYTQQQAPTFRPPSTAPRSPIISSSTEPQISPPHIPSSPRRVPPTTYSGTSLLQELDDFEKLMQIFERQPVYIPPPFVMTSPISPPRASTPVSSRSTADDTTRLSQVPGGHTASAVASTPRRKQIPTIASRIPSKHKTTTRSTGIPLPRGGSKIPSVSRLPQAQASRTGSRIPSGTTVRSIPRGTRIPKPGESRPRTKQPPTSSSPGLPQGEAEIFYLQSPPSFFNDSRMLGSSFIEYEDRPMNIEDLSLASLPYLTPTPPRQSPDPHLLEQLGLSSENLETTEESCDEPQEILPRPPILGPSSPRAQDIIDSFNIESQRISESLRENAPEQQILLDDEEEIDDYDDMNISERSPGATRIGISKQLQDIKKDYQIIKSTSPAAGGVPVTTPRKSPIPKRSLKLFLKMMDKTYL